MRRHWWVSGTRARRPLARHLAGRHGSAAPHTGGSPVPFRQGARHMGPVPPHAPRALCWGEGASAPGREGGVDVQTHAWGTSHSMRQLPRQPTARASRCERVFNISIPRPQSPGPLEGKGPGWGEGGGGRVDRSLSREAQRAKSWNCLGMGAWGRGGGEGPEAGRGQARLPHSFMTPLPARLPGHLLVQNGGERAGQGQHLGRVGGEEVWPR